METQLTAGNTSSRMFAVPSKRPLFWSYLWAFAWRNGGVSQITNRADWGTFQVCRAKEPTFSSAFSFSLSNHPISNPLKSQKCPLRSIDSRVHAIQKSSIAIEMKHLHFPLVIYFVENYLVSGAFLRHYTMHKTATICDGWVSQGSKIQTMPIPVWLTTKFPILPL